MEENKVTLIRVLDVPIEKVWDAWTKAENLMQWKSPEGMTTPFASVDLKVDGEYTVTMNGPHANGSGDLTVRGLYKIIKKPQKLQFSWKWDGQEEESLVTIILKEVSKNKTELKLTHSGFKSQDSSNLHNIGWKSTFNKLEKFVS